MSMAEWNAAARREVLQELADPTWRDARWIAEQSWWTCTATVRRELLQLELAGVRVEARLQHHAEDTVSWTDVRRVTYQGQEVQHVLGLRTFAPLPM